MALLTKFSMFQDVAADRWNIRVLKYREKMNGMCRTSKEESNEEI